VRQYAAPAASLLAVTAAVLAVHYGLQHRPTAAPPSTVVRTVPRHPHVKRTAAFTQVYVVQRGDSFSVIAAKTHTSVATLERLNPGVSTTALRVGQRLKVK
jgi:LysM repeat protein